MTSLTRRRFAELLALTGSAALFPRTVWTRESVEDLGLTAAPLPQAPPAPDESYWRQVRARFLVPQDLNFLNAANLCPTSLAAVEALERATRAYEAGPTPEARNELMVRGKEESRKLLAEALRVTPEEIVITRNTSEGNNLVSSGLDLKAGDEVIVWADNHPSNLNAWQDEGASDSDSPSSRAPLVPAHPGTDGYVDLFAKLFTPRTKLVAITHVNSNSATCCPRPRSARAARKPGILSLVDGAQSFGVLDIDLAAMKPDFYTGSHAQVGRAARRRRASCTSTRRA